MIRVGKALTLPLKSPRLFFCALGVAGASLVGVTAATGSATAPAANAATADYSQPGWYSGGQNIFDTHYAAAEHTVDPGNAAQLAPRWTFTTGGSVTATPTVVNGVVYVPDWGGNLWAINAYTGQTIWSNQISTYTGSPQDISRLSPAYWNGELVLGDGAQTGTSAGAGAADVFAVNAATGGLLWKTHVDTDPAAIVTSSPVIFGGVVYVGVSSQAEIQPNTPTFRGTSSPSTLTPASCCGRPTPFPPGTPVERSGAAPRPSTPPPGWCTWAAATTTPCRPGCAPRPARPVALRPPPTTTSTASSV